MPAAVRASNSETPKASAIEGENEEIVGFIAMLQIFGSRFL
jgi:hypothetical protein